MNKKVKLYDLFFWRTVQLFYMFVAAYYLIHDNIDKQLIEFVPVVILIIGIIFIPDLIFADKIYIISEKNK